MTFLFAAMRPLFNKGDASKVCGSLDDVSPSTAGEVSPRPDTVAVVRLAGFSAEGLRRCIPS